MTPEKFIAKWGAAELSESSAAQQHFLDLCALLGQVPPAEADPTGETFTFEKGGATATGGHGWADVWKKGAFAWEYKGPGKDLQAAYYQLKKYADALENPPLLITSDLKRIEIHTNFTNTVKVVHVLQLEDLKNPIKRELLRNAFAAPEQLRPGITRHMVTKEAAERFSELAHHLQAKGYDPQRVAHFLNRLIFCMFAEDVGLLPNKIFSKLAIASVAHPETFETNAKQLFGGMSKGGSVAFEVIDWFNGGLFDDDSTLPLDKKELELVVGCAELDWSNIEPSIFGTLFERGLDPDKRSQQGTHYTDPETIMKIVRPVVLEPWSRQWEEEKAALSKLADKAKKGISEAAQKRYQQFLERLHQYRVFDPACGSGNFLYLALRGLKDFEKRVMLEAELLGLPRQFPRVGPEAVLGIEVNPYAAELARVTIWIGELQWMIDNGFGASKNPILKPLDQIECRDAILGEDGSEPRWPEADAIVGNPPFLGDKRMIAGLGESYVQTLRALYSGRVPGGADLVMYWFAKAQAQFRENRASCAGLVCTQSVRAGANRRALSNATTGCTIFNAWSDEAWINEGAAVRVSMICFAPAARGGQPIVSRNGEEVAEIFVDLEARHIGRSAVDLTQAKRLIENESIAYIGTQKNGDFELPRDVARVWLAAPNPNGRPNSDVIRPWVNGRDVASRPEGLWIVDFGCSMLEPEAALYELPFEHVRQRVLPERATLRRDAYRELWWRHAECRPGLRRALRPLKRFIATPRVSKHRIFVWLGAESLPDTRLCVLARQDAAFFGIVHSAIHEAWSLANASMHGVGNDPTYTALSCFETFPFPDGLRPTSSAEDWLKHSATARIATAAERLDELRRNWLNPPEYVDAVPDLVPGYPKVMVPKNEVSASELKRRTLTNLYNVNPPWLQHVRLELDEAVAAAYGWEWPLTEQEILRKLFDLNQARATVDLGTKTTKSVKRAEKGNRSGPLL